MDGRLLSCIAIDDFSNILNETLDFNACIV